MSEQSRSVFISYASQDGGPALRICQALQAADIDVWFDQSELRGGDAWDERIRRQIRDCTLFLPIISANTVSRHEGYFRLEWALAEERSRMIARNRAFIVPVCVDKTADTVSDVPESFQRVQWTRLPAGETPAAFADHIRHLLSPDQSTAAGIVARRIEVTDTKSASANLSSSKIVLLGLVAVAVFASGYVAADRLLTAKRAEKQKQAIVATPSSTVPVDSRTPEKSIAVLPFLDLSEKKDQEYFSDGLSEELLDLLAQVPDLRVAARTSSFYFKGKADDVASIGQRLRVAHILEGSVRKARQTVRVTVQLIRADNGYHLWSKTYDRDVKDIFKVQDDIATAVVAALKAQLLPSQQLASRHRTDNTAAYAQYLIGNRFRYFDDPESNQQALVAFQKAIALDPGYASAFAALSEVEWRIADQDTGDAAGYARAAAAAEKAIMLAPESPEGYWARGRYRYAAAFDWPGSETDLLKALALDPDFAPARSVYAELLETLGRLPEAMLELRKALAVDPLSPDVPVNMMNYLLATGDLAAARRVGQQMIEDKIPNGYEWSGLVALVGGNFEQALDAFQKALPLSQLYNIPLAEYSLGHFSMSDTGLANLVRHYSKTLAYQIAEIYAWRGEKDRAFEWLQIAYRQHDRGITSVRYDPLLANLRGDLRYHALLRELKLPD